MRADNQLVTTDNVDLSKELRFAISIDFDGTAQFFTSHGDIANVPGTPIENVLQGVAATTQTLNPDRANATIGSASFDLVDKDEAFTDHVRTELLTNAVGLRGRTVNMYIGYKTDQEGAGIIDGSSTDDNPDFDNFALFQTQVVESVETKEGKYTIKCADIQRETKREIFELALTYLTASIDDVTTTIPVLDLSGFEGLVHGTSYSDAPSQEVIYIKMEKTKEIIRCPVSGISGNSFTGVTRGVFGTGAAAVEVDVAKAADRKPKVEEYVYLEMPAVKLAYAVLTGVIEGTANVLPASWHAGVPTSFVRLTDFQDIGTDLWDTTDDTAGIVLRFDGIEKQDAKRFLETEIYLLLGLFSPVYADGQLGLKRMVPSLSDSPFSQIIDDDNIKSTANLRHDMNSMQNNLRIDWNWNGDRYIRSTIVVDSGSIAKHGQAPEKRLQFRGLVGSRYTEQVLRQLLTSLRDMYTGPPLRLTAQGFHLLNQLEVGDAVRVNLSSIRDYTQIGSNLNRTMAIHGMTVDWLGGVKLRLFGSSERADEIPPVTATTCLPDAFYPSVGAALSTIPGLMSGNATNAGTFTLVGTADMNAAGSIFYWDNDLTISSGTTINIEGNVQLRVKGFLTIDGTIDGTGEGHVSGSNLYDAGQHYYWAADKNLGTPGFIGNSVAHFGLLFRYPDNGGIPNWVWGTMTSEYPTKGLYDAFPNIVLAVDETGSGSISGIPTDMRGGGGSYGPPAGEKTGLSGRTYQRASGGAGGAGGAALCVVCRGGDFGISGQITLDGADSIEPTTFWAETGGDYDIYGGAGGAGCPGALLWLLDGSAVQFPDLAGHFQAKTGVVPAQYALPLVRGQMNQSLSNENRPRKNMAPFSPYLSITDHDQTAVNFRISYLPCDITPEEDQDEVVPPPTNLVASPFTGGTDVDWDNPGPATFDHIEVWVANANARAGASLLTTTKNSKYIENAANIQRNRYYWVRAVDADGNVSEFEPSTTTTTAIAFPQIQTPAIATDPFIRLGAANWEFINHAAEPDAIAQYAVGVGTGGTDALELQNDIDLIDNIDTRVRSVKRRGPDEWDTEAFPGMVVEVRCRMKLLNTITSNPFAPKIDCFIETSKEDGTNSRSYNCSGGKFWNTAGEDGTWYDMLYTALLDNEPVDDEPRYINLRFDTPSGFAFQRHVYIDFADATVQATTFQSNAVDGAGSVGLVPKIVASIQNRVLNDQGGWSMSPGGQAQPAYDFDNTTTSGDPGSGMVRFNNATLASVTNLYISSTDIQGFDTDTVMNFLADENRIYFEAGSTKNRAAIFEVNGTPTDNTGWWTIPVTVVASDVMPGANEHLGFTMSFTKNGSGAGGVTTFNGRSGAVSPIQADYDSFFLTPAEGDAAYATVGHIHNAFDRSTAVLAGANVFSDIIVADGIVTGIATRALTPANIGAVPTSDHPHSTFDRASTVLSGAQVFSNIVVTDGITTGIASRSLTPADIGAQAAGTYVNTFNGRSGAVSPLQADYDAFFLTPAEGNAAYSLLGHTHAAADVVSGTFDPNRIRQIDVTDTRAVDDAPDDFDNAVQFDFKQRSVIGFPGNDTYGGMMTIAPWNGTSGGPNYQLVFSNFSNVPMLAMRAGDHGALPGDWGAWHELFAQGRNVSLLAGDDIVLSTTSIIDFTDSSTEKIILFGAEGNSSAYSLGIESNTMYRKASQNHRWYIGSNADAGVSHKMNLSATSLFLDNDIFVQIGTSGRGNGQIHLHLAQSGTDPGSPGAGDLWFGAAGLKFHDGSQTHLLTAGADITADEDVTGAWNFQAQVDIESNGEALRIGRTGNDSNQLGWISFEDSLDVSYGRIGKLSSGHNLTIEGSGNIQIESGAAGVSEIVLDATGGVLGGNIRLIPNAVGPGRVRIENENGDYFTLEHDGTKAILDDPGGLTANLTIQNMAVVLNDANLSFGNGSNFLTFNPGTNEVVVSGTGMDALRFAATVNLELADASEIRFGNSNDATLEFDGTNLVLTSAVGSFDFSFVDIDLDMNDNQIIQPVLRDYAIETPAQITGNTNHTLTYSNGPCFDVDLELWSVNRTITLSGGPPSGTYGQITVRVRQDGTAARTITWAGGVFTWAGGSQHVQNPTLNGLTIYTFETWDAGANWHGGGADYS